MGKRWELNEYNKYRVGIQGMTCNVIKGQIKSLKFNT